MSEENKTEEEKQETKKKNEEFEETIGKLFLICMFIGGGFYLFKTMDEKLDIRLDFERKSYIPYSINNETFLINKYNGKTYKLKKYETKDRFYYKYDFIAKPKTKNKKYYLKDPLNLAF